MKVEDFVRSDVQAKKDHVICVRLCDATMEKISAMAADREWTIAHVVRYLVENSFKEAPDGH